VENAELGNRFPGLVGNLVIDPKGRVKVYTSVFFYTDLDCLDSYLLSSILERLNAEQNNKTLLRLRKKLSRLALTKLGNLVS
jgi:hypothetical protein